MTSCISQTHETLQHIEQSLTYANLKNHLEVWSFQEGMHTVTREPNWITNVWNRPSEGAGGEGVQTYLTLEMSRVCRQKTKNLHVNTPVDKVVSHGDGVQRILHYIPTPARSIGLWRWRYYALEISIERKLYFTESPHQLYMLTVLQKIELSEGGNTKLKIIHLINSRISAQNSNVWPLTQCSC